MVSTTQNQGRGIKQLSLHKLRHFARQLKADATTIYFAARHALTPLPVRLFALATAAYALSPIDLIPDFIPVLGYLDEIILLPIAISLILKLTPDAVIAQCRLRASEATEKISSPACAIVVVVIWTVCAVSAIYWIR